MTALTPVIRPAAELIGDELNTLDAMRLAGHQATRSTLYTIGTRVAAHYLPPGQRGGPGSRTMWTPTGVRVARVHRLLGLYPIAERLAAAEVVRMVPAEQPGAVVIRPGASWGWLPGMDVALTIRASHPADTVVLLVPVPSFAQLERGGPTP